MILTAKQEEGLKLAVARFKAHEPYTTIAGYAGTGKSTLVRFIISALGLDPSEVCYIAYTGKAAQVLKQKGCPNPVTAHKLLYKAQPMPNGTYKFVPKLSLEGDFRLIVVDEVSMLPRTMWQRLLSHRIHVIALGDPFQLPPVDKDEDNEVLLYPHIFLDEIMRQASESEIIRFSMHIREMKPVEEFKASGEQVLIVNPNEVSTGMYLWADQILCATNATRFGINKSIRELKGFGDEPEVGDKIISLRNQWEFLSASKNFDGSPLTNGTIGTIQYSDKSYINLPYWLSTDRLPVLYTTMIDENQDRFDYIPIDYTSLVEGRKILTPKQEFQMRKSQKLPDPPFEFAYAYAITCHKAQGSEWKKVLTIEEKFPFDKEEHARWLYTAATRASGKLVVVKS